MMQIDKRNGNVCFNDENHKYFDVNDESKQYISVTTLIDRYGQEFNKDFWSAYKALEKLLSKDAWQLEKKSLLASKKCNKDMGFAIGLTILPFIFYPILGFGDSKFNNSMAYYSFIAECIVSSGADR